MLFSEYRALGITSDGEDIVEIPTDDRRALDWNWVNRRHNIEQVFDCLLEGGWKVMGNLPDEPDKYMVGRIAEFRTFPNFEKVDAAICRGRSLSGIC
jgi:hypothetical protein